VTIRTAAPLAQKQAVSQVSTVWENSDGLLSNSQLHRIPTGNTVSAVVRACSSFQKRLQTVSILPTQNVIRITTGASAAGFRSSLPHGSLNLRV